MSFSVKRSHNILKGENLVTLAPTAQLALQVILSSPTFGHMVRLGGTEGVDIGTEATSDF
jgi:hypothetical protein